MERFRGGLNVFILVGFWKRSKLSRLEQGCTGIGEFDLDPLERFRDGLNVFIQVVWKRSKLSRLEQGCIGIGEVDLDRFFKTNRAWILPLWAGIPLI
ncbi:hypothetical protein SLA2020_196100 [Shorea laevis]